MKESEFERKKKEKKKILQKRIADLIKEAADFVKEDRPVFALETIKKVEEILMENERLERKG